MRRFSLTQLLLFVTWFAILCASASRYFSMRPYLGATDYGEGTYSYGTFFHRTETTITPQMVEQSPIWHPGDANPSVSARAALRVADRFRREKLIDANKWKWVLESIRLLPLDGDNNKWCWQITFGASPIGAGGSSGGSGGATSFSVFILMDGSVIEPDYSTIFNLDESAIFDPEK